MKLKGCLLYVMINGIYFVLYWNIVKIGID